MVGLLGVSSVDFWISCQIIKIDTHIKILEVIYISKTLHRSSGVSLCETMACYIISCYQWNHWFFSIDHEVTLLVRTNWYIDSPNEDFALYFGMTHHIWWIVQVNRIQLYIHTIHCIIIKVDISVYFKNRDMTMNTKLQKQGNEQSILHFLSGGGEDVVLSGLRNRRWYTIFYTLKYLVPK